MAVFSGCLVSILFLIGVAQGRILSLNSSDDHLISDGIDCQDLNLSTCQHQYGFLPCGENAAGYIFLILVYEVLLVVGGMIIRSGSEVLYYLIGENLGGILFRILKALPSMMLMICTGVSSTKETAQAQVSSVVGIYAGTTVFSLTIQWFVCLVTSSKPLKDEEEDEATSSSENCFPIKEKLRILIDNGVNVDLDTCRTAKIMLLSLIPYVVLQLVYLFDNSSGKRIITLISLIVSASSLIGYFVYQIRNPWMQQRSLNYSKIDVVQREVLQHVEKLGKLVNKDGTANEDLVKSFFVKADNDQNNFVAEQELENLMSKPFKAGKTKMRLDDAIKSMLSKLDSDEDKKITEKEFTDGVIKWINEAKNTASTSDSSPRETIQKFARILKGHKNNSSDLDRIISKLLKQFEGQLLKSEALITDNGEPNIERIRHLFREYDTDKSGFLSPGEVKQLIGKVKFGTAELKDKDVLKKMFKAFDADGNNLIDEGEFVKAMQEYLDKAMKVVNATKKTNIFEEFDKIVWEEQVYGKKSLFKSLVQVVVGIAMLTFLAGPLLGNILNLSDAMKAPSFLVSFVVVPIALNGQSAIATFLSASKKTIGTSSLSFSEIYGGVIMNNISGLTGLLAIVYAKGLIWDFSAEVLTIMVVCGVVGAQAFLNETYKLWTGIPVFLLYPISLGLFYYFQVVCSWN